MAGDILSIDVDKCTGCGKCASVCIRGGIAVKDGRATETHGSCFRCWHCAAVCLAGAIGIASAPDFEGEPVPKEPPVDYGTMMSFLKQRRSIRLFTGEKVTGEEFGRLFEAGRYSPTGMNAQGTEFTVIDRELGRFMQAVYESLKPLENEFPRIREFCRYHENPDSQNGRHPLLWEGKQIVIAFSGSPVDAAIAMTRIELTAYTMGLGGFYSLFLMKALERDPEKFSEIFSEMEHGKKPACAFVIGHPRIAYRRTVPPRDLKVSLL